MTQEQKLLRRTKLIVLPYTTELVQKAIKSNADIVHLELEDGVLPDKKEYARQCALEILKNCDRRGKELWVRINSIQSGLTEQDVDVTARARPAAYLLTKVRSVDDIQKLDGYIKKAEKKYDVPIDSIKIAAVIERVSAVIDIRDIAKASPRMTSLVLGSEDLANEYGYRRDYEGPALELLYTRSAMILAAHAALIDAIDAPYLFQRDLEGTKRDALRSIQLGFDGKACLSPRQVDIVNEVFSPTEKEIDWAKRLMDEWEKCQAQGEALFVLDGAMIDMPLVIKARRIIQRADLKST